MITPDTQPQREHCGHECVCSFHHSPKFPCSCNQPALMKCQHDTRTRPHTPAPRPPCGECIWQHTTAPPSICQNCKNDYKDCDNHPAECATPRTPAPEHGRWRDLGNQEMTSTPQQHTECYLDGYKDGERAATLAAYEKVIDKLTVFKEKLASREMSDCSLEQSRKYGSGRIAIEGGIKLISSLRTTTAQQEEQHL